MTTALIEKRARRVKRQRRIRSKVTGTAERPRLSVFRSNRGVVAQLVDDGILYKKRGIGMFVTPNARDLLRTGRRDSFFADVVDPMIREAKAIGIPLNDILQHVRSYGDA